MLKLIDIKKDYKVAGEAVPALKGITLSFRRNEFVSILGASGCGKTTLLNIIGGLDHYTSGDLQIEGVSTKQFTDRDWDTYRNHSIGFIFQSYHLIPHQTVLQNVELALTISGVSKEERRARAIEALDKVGLKDKINNKPNQLSGGQAQRVAIARALINDPEVVLADEPTGALDSKTSVQIMELLKEISRDRLVIMVTHNPELAEQYSTRIIRLLDGNVIGDSKPYTGEEEPQEQPQSAPPVEKKSKGAKKRSSMSFGMAFMLSLKNLLSKSKRTAMVAIAGSIGIIGVSMVLAISSGVQGYIKSMEDDMLSGYPLQVTESAIDFNALMDFANSSGVKVDVTRLNDKVYVDSLLETLMNFKGAMSTNNITYAYKDFVDKMPSEYYNALQYGYDFDLANYIYTDFNLNADKSYTENVSVTAIRAKYTSILGKQKNYGQYSSLISTMSSFEEIPNNYEYILSQYDVLAGEENLKEVLESKDSLIMVVKDNGFTDLNFAQFGYMTEDEFLNFAYKAEDPDSGKWDQSVIDGYMQGKDFDFFIGENAHSFKFYPNDTIYTKASPTEIFYIDYNGVKVPVTCDYKYVANSAHFAKDRDKSSDIDLKVKVILQKKKGVSYGCLSSGLYYTNALTQHVLQTSQNSKIANYIKENGELSFMPYKYDFYYTQGYGQEYIKETDAVSYVYKRMQTNMMMSFGGSTSREELLKVDLGLVGGTDLPASFNIYPLDFENKDFVTEYLDGWNDMCNAGASYTYTDADGTQNTITLSEADIVKYTDSVGLIITMVNTMIEMITIALIAFTALSLVVSTVMVGIITYVSVVERIKEIGILRSVGARKKDIKRLFNAETFIIGFAAGLVGIVVTYILSLLINLIVGSLTGVFSIAALPWWQAFIMVGVSVILTLISGLIPASAAAKKDPVVALRTE